MCRTNGLGRKIWGEKKPPKKTERTYPQEKKNLDLKQKRKIFVKREK